jgi:hypothetical protein
MNYNDNSINIGGSVSGSNVITAPLHSTGPLDSPIVSPTMEPMAFSQLPKKRWGYYLNKLFIWVVGIATAIIPLLIIAKFFPWAKT